MTKKSYGEAILTPKAEGISRVSRDLLIVLRDVTYSLALLGNFVRFAHSASLVFSLRLFPSFVVKGILCLLSGKARLWNPSFAEPRHI